MSSAAEPLRDEVCPEATFANIPVLQRVSNCGKRARVLKLYSLELLRDSFRDFALPRWTWSRSVFNFILNQSLIPSLAITHLLRLWA